MANNCKQFFNAYYQPHCHPTTNSLWLCSSVHCEPPHQSRRIWLSAEADNQKDSLVTVLSNTVMSHQHHNSPASWLFVQKLWTKYSSKLWIIDPLCKASYLQNQSLTQKYLHTIATRIVCPWHQMSQTNLIRRRSNLISRGSCES